MDNKHDQTATILCLLLKELSKSKGIGEAEIAEKTGMKRPNVNALLNGRKLPELKTFLKVAEAVGVNFFFEDKDGSSDISKAFNGAMDEMYRRKMKNLN